MNTCRRPSVASAVRWWVVLPFVALSLAAPGCGMGGGAPPPEGQMAIENVAKWYQLYRADHRGRPPADEDAFTGYIQSKLDERGQTLDRDKLLTSPRDGQAYVIRYGKPTSNNMDRNVAVYEQEGYRGKKLVAFEAAWAKEVDDAELQSLLAGQ